MLTVVFVALKAANTLIICSSDHDINWIITLSRPKIVDASLMLISMIGQRVCRYPLCLSNLPIQSLWKDVAMQLFVCRKCKTKDR